MASVVVDGVTKEYGGVEVLHDLLINVQGGEFVALVGPSGCGKSTLLRMIAGLEEVSGGEISIGGAVVNDVLPKNRNVAMVFQNYALYPHMTVADNMGFALKLSGTPRNQIRDKVKKAAGILGLEELLDRLPAQLSGGQRQRAAMGRAIVRNPEVFLFDEPLSNLDAKLRIQMRSEIKALHQRLEATTIYVTHDQVEAMTMADKIVVMNDGNIEQAGSPLALYDNPRNTFVASFIGAPSMNLIEGRIEAEDNKAVFRSHTGVRLPLAQELNYPTGSEAVYGIRPEHFSLGEDPHGTPATVGVVEPLGSETQVFMNLNGQWVTGLFRERIAPPTGTELLIFPDLAHVHLFEKGTGRRIECQPQ